MSYIGNTNTTQAFTPAVDFFNGDGSTVAFTLSKPVASVAQVQAVISNVPQNPGSAYTVSGNTITFTSAPPSGTSNIYVYYTSPITQVIAPGQNTVTTTALMDGSVTPAKLSTGAPTWDANGSVGVGVTPSAWGSSYKALQVGVTAALASETAGNTRLYSNIYYDGSSLRYIATAPASQYSQFQGTHYWYTAISGTAGSAVSLTQSLAVGKGTSLALEGASSVTGTGVSFPATQSASTDANTLDDYEEGTWTPTDASGAGLSFTVLDARYTKVGRIVECFAQINYPSTANGNGASVGGLPFTSANTSGGAYGAFTCYTNYSQASWLISGATTTTQPYTFAGAQVTNSAISGKQFRLVWIYEV